MAYQHRSRTAAPRHQPLGEDTLDLDAFRIDDALDDYLDRHVAAIRESLADFRNV